MAEQEWIGKILFVFVFVVAGAVMFATDTTHPIPDTAPPVSIDDFSINALLQDVPQISLFDVTRESEGGFWTDIGLAFLDATGDALKTIANVILSGVNAIIAGGFLLINLTVRLSLLFRFDLWPAFQIHPFVATLGLALTVVFGGAVLVFVVLLVLRAIPFVG